MRECLCLTNTVLVFGQTRIVFVHVARPLDKVLFLSASEAVGENLFHIVLAFCQLRLKRGLDGREGWSSLLLWRWRSRRRFSFASLPAFGSVRLGEERTSSSSQAKSDSEIETRMGRAGLLQGKAWQRDGGGTKERRSRQSTGEHTADGQRPGQSDPAKTSSQTPHLRHATPVLGIGPEYSSAQVLNLSAFRFALLKFTLSSSGPLLRPTLSSARRG